MLTTRILIASFAVESTSDLEVGADTLFLRNNVFMKRRWLGITRFYIYFATGDMLYKHYEEIQSNKNAQVSTQSCLCSDEIK